MSERKTNKRTFIKMHKCIGKNGNSYIDFTGNVWMRNIQPIKEIDGGKKVLNFDVIIHEQEKYIETMCGLKPYTDKNGNIYARVSAWDSGNVNLATRITNLLNSPSLEGKALKVTLTGAIKVEQSESDDGKVYNNVRITADDVSLIQTNENTEKNITNNSLTPEQPVTNTADNGFTEIDDDDDLPF